MAKKKAATRPSKRAKRRKTTSTAESDAGSDDAATGTNAEPETLATEQEHAATAEDTAGRPAAKRTKAVHRRTRKKPLPAAAKAARSTPRDPSRAPKEAEPAPGEGPSPPKRRKKRGKRKRHASRTAGVDESSAEAVTAEAREVARITPVSASAEIEQSDDTIVIRFPATMPTNGPVGPLAAEVEEAPPAVEAEPGSDVPDFTAEPPIDWELAEQGEAIAEEPQPEPDSLATAPELISDAIVPLASIAAETAETPLDEATAPLARPKRRRRRKKKAHRPAPEEEPRPKADKELGEDRQRPEPVVEPTEDALPKPEERPQRRRRRRSRRHRKQSAPVIAAEDGSEIAVAEEEAGAKVEPGVAPAASHQKEMIINVVPREECRIAIMAGGKLQEIYLERASAENYVGNIYKGLVTNVEPSIQAAFIDFGQGKNGFLHISDLHPQYFPDGEGQTENVGRKMPRRNRPPIQRCLRRKQELLVQITKEGIGTKGPTLTTYLSIPGRFLVMMPGMRQLGVSRKIEDDEARRKLRNQLAELDLPENIGFIARTAALDHTKRELQSDLNYLTRLWKAVTKRIKNQPAPTELYTESDLVIRTIRDVFTSDVTRIVVDDPEVARRANEFLSIFSPRARDIVVEYSDPQPIFHRYRIEVELERLHSRHVPLKSGGSLVIDQTEALVAIDVNSGRFRTEDDAEATAFKINLEAADEIPRQLRLRDLGGVVICDFIDMRQEKHKREIERRLNRNLKEHKERAKILRMSDFGIIELTRQRQRASLTRSVYQDCRHCRGSGLVKTAESVALDVTRLMQLAVTHDNIRTIEVSVSPEVAHLLQNRKRAQLHRLEAANRRSISIRTDPSFGLDQIQMQYYDPRGRLVPHP